MESHIKIKATQKEMTHWFHSCQNISIRFMKRIEENLYQVTLRHDERARPLKGTYQFKTLRRIFATYPTTPTIKSTLQRWAKNANWTLDTMAQKAFENGWCEYKVLTYSELQQYICDMVEQGNCVCKLLESLEENRRADYFCFDISRGGNFQATPIYDKDELMQAILYGSL